MIPGFVAMGIWLLVPPILFHFLPPHRAALLTFLSAALFLPEAYGFDVPALPPMGKEELSSIACMLCCLVFAPGRLLEARPLRGPEFLVVVLAFGAIVSIFLNLDPLHYGIFDVPAMDPAGAFQGALHVVIIWGFPFFIGRAFFTQSRHLRDLFLILTLAGLVYSFFILLEIRLSPQMHRWVYGYHQHDFSQTIRGGGYRPMVFMRHGLNLTLFVVMCMTSAWIHFKVHDRRSGVSIAPKLLAACFLTTILLISRSTGSMLYGLLSLAFVVFLSIRSQTALAVALSVLVLAYPAIRTAQLLPVEEIVQLAEEQFGEERASSMAARLRTEEQLTTYVQERPLFGWGSPGRAMVIDEFTGENKTVFDGFWLIEFVGRGLVGFVCVFVLLLIPVFRAAGNVGAIRSKSDRMLVAGLAVMVAVRVFDLLPNSPTEGYLTLLSGALSGSVFGILREQSAHRRTEHGERSDSDAGVGSGDPGSGRSRAGGQNPTLGRDLLGASGSRRRPRKIEA